MNKILFFHHTIGRDGAGISLANLISELDASKFSATVVMPLRPGNDAVKRMFENSGAKVIEEKHIRPFNGVNGCPCNSAKQRAYAILSALPTLLASRKIILKCQPDIVHANTMVLPFALAGSQLANRQIPRVSHVRETVNSNWWGKLLAKLNFWFGSHFIGIDQHGLNRIGSTQENSTVVRNFVDQRFFELNKLERPYRLTFQCTSNTVLFLYLSRINSANGALELAKFLREHYKEIDSRAKFAFCGFERIKDSYATAVSEQIRDVPIAFEHEFVEDVVNLVNSSDVMISPYITAHSSRCIIEGAALGKPALITDHPNLREQIKVNESGFIINFNSPSDAIQKINLLASESNLRIKMGNVASQFAEEQFSAEVNTKKVMDLYTKLLN